MRILNPVTGNYDTISIKALDGLCIGMGVDYYGTINDIPTGWLVCDGSAVSRTEYAELFAVIGTQFGSGDGSTTFNLPNKCGKYGVGYDPNDSDFNAVGKTGGNKSVSYTPEGTNTNGAVQSHTLTSGEMPSHSHTLTPSNFHANTYNLLNAGTANQGGSWIGNDQFALAAARNMPSTNFPDVLNASNLMQSLGTDSKGGNQGHTHDFTQPTFTGTAKNVNVVGPYEVQLFIIKAKNTTAVFASIYDAYSTSTKDGYACSYINSIIESGSNANGNWIKYKDGTMICTKEVTSSVEITSAWGTMYEGLQDFGNWAQEFYSTPIMNVLNKSPTGAIPESFNLFPSKTYAGKYFWCRPSAGTYTLTAEIIAIGRWKA